LRTRPPPEAQRTAGGQADDGAPGRAARQVASAKFGDHERRATCVHLQRRSCALQAESLAASARAVAAPTPRFAPGHDGHSRRQLRPDDAPGLLMVLVPWMSRWPT